MQDAKEEIRRAALGGLAQTCKDEIDRELLSEDIDGFGPWLDPQAPITVARINEAAEDLEQPVQAIASRYKELAQRFGLTLEPEVAAMAKEQQENAKQAP